MNIETLNARSDKLETDLNTIQASLKSLKEQEALLLAQFHRASGHLLEVKYQIEMMQKITERDMLNGQVNNQAEK